MAPSTPGSVAGTRRTVAGLAALVAIAAAAAWPTLWTAVDDAFISARYAEHLATGHGWTWNAAGPAVEGFSNPLWTAWIAVGLRLGADAHTWMVVWGLVGWLGAIPASYGLSRALVGRDSAGVGPWVAPVALASSPLAAVAATNGLETGWWLTGLLAASWGAVAAETVGAQAVAGVGLGLLAWLRPEGLVVGPLWLGFRALRGRPVGAVAGGWVGAVGLLFGWRLLTFGAWLPNTAGAKFGGHGWAWTLDTNRAYLMRAPLTWLLVTSGAVATLAGGLRRPEVLAPLGLGALLVAPALTVELWMPGGRLLLPGLAFTAVAASVAVSDRPRVAGIALVLALAQWLPGPQRTARVDDRAHSVLPDSGSARAGRWLRDHAPDGATLVIRDAGCLAFHAGPGVHVLENHERALTRTERGAIDGSTLTAPPTVVVLTQAREDATDVHYPTDRRLLEALPGDAYRFRGRVYQHFHRYYDLFLLESAGLPELPPTLVVGDGPAR